MIRLWGGRLPGTVRLALLILLAGLQITSVAPASSSTVAGNGTAQVVARPAQWSMHMNGPRRLGRSRFVGPQTSNLAWRYSTQTNYGGAVIGPDSTVYVGTLDGTFLAFHPDGSLKWTISVAPRTVEPTPAFLLDGRVAFLD